MNEIPDSHADLTRDDVRAYAYLATTMPDGTPQLTPVWFNTDGRHILINSAKGRVKDRNMRTRPDVAVVLHNHDKPYPYVQIRGQIVEITEEGARQHINDLSLKYRGDSDYKLNDPNEIRVIYKLLPESIQVME